VIASVGVCDAYNWAFGITGRGVKPESLALASFPFGPVTGKHVSERIGQATRAVRRTIQAYPTWG